MHFDSRIPILWLSNLLLLLLTMMVNSRLAPYSLYLILPGLMLILPALYLKSPSLIVLCFITGISIDSLLPQPHWIFTYGFPFIGLLIRSIRSHFRTEKSYRFLMLAHIANFSCLALIYLSQGIVFGQFYDSLAPITFMGLLSHLILCLIAPWFFNFQRMMLGLFHMEHAYQDEFSKL